MSNFLSSGAHEAQKQLYSVRKLLLPAQGKIGYLRDSPAYCWLRSDLDGDAVAAGAFGGVERVIGAGQKIG